MSTRLNIPVQTHGIWHAGRYDDTDLLGKDNLQGSHLWMYKLESAMAECYDYSYFGTAFHWRMFKSKVISQTIGMVSGQPHELLVEQIQKERNSPITMENDPTVVWPHRLSPDKQVDLARKIREQLKPYGIKLIMTKEENLPKRDYYRLLHKSDVVLSTALHENLGISMIEAVLLGCHPVIPWRSSYPEIFEGISTEPHVYYHFTPELIVEMIREAIKRPQPLSKEQLHSIALSFMNANVMYNNLVTR